MAFGTAGAHDFGVASYAPGELAPHMLTFDASYRVPVMDEISPLTQSVSCMLRIK